jgi:N6-adenosine-specific RNA methylase IME4
VLIDVVDSTTGRLIALEQPGLGLPGEHTEVSLALPDGMPFEEWAAVGETLCAVEKSIPWLVGDWWAYGERRYGKRKEISDRLREQGRKIPQFQALADYGWVASKFETSRRREALSHAHHREVASLPQKEQDELLDWCEEPLAEGRPPRKSRELRAAASQRKAARAIGSSMPSDETCTVDDLQALLDQGRRFGTVYADPPWLYDNQGTRASTGHHYSGLTVDQICELPIRQLAADDAHLHLWTTNGFLFECPRIFAAWGFEFRSSFVWTKPQMGIGNYWRNSHELLLTAIRGNAKRFNDHSLRSWLECDRGEHSGKPEEIRGFVERASPGPRLELFGRAQTEGWSVWGNQVSRASLLSDQDDGPLEAVA